MEAQQTVKPQTAFPKVKDPVNASETQFFERIWKYTLLVCSITGAVLVDRVFKYRSSLPSDEYHGSGYHLLVALPIMLVFHICKSYLDKKCSPLIVPLLCNSRFKTEEKKQERSHLLSKWVFDVFYYITTSIIGVYIMIDHQSFPNIPQGSLMCKNVLSRTIPQTHLTAMEYFYILQFSNHLYALASHCLDSNVYGKSKFFEYCLHHGMAVFLIFYSYMLNIWTIGTMVLIFHDASDAMLIIGRFYLDMQKKSKKVLHFLFVLTFVVWVFCRLTMFPVCCIYPVFSENSPVEVLFLGYMESGLLIMHVYWTYFFIYSATSFSKRKSQY